MSINNLPQIDGELGWYETALNRELAIGRSLQGTHSYDVVIVGGGYTGLSLAERLRELRPNASIAVIDALKIGQGTSGRNAGFIIDLPHNLDTANHDTVKDRQIYSLNRFAIERLRSFQERFSIECSWQDAGKYMAAHEHANLAGLRSFMETLDAGHFPYEFLEGKILEQKLGTKYYRAAVFTPGSILMNPSALIRGIASGLQKKSIDVFDESPVVSILSSPKGSTVHSVGGTIHAGILVHTTNSFAEEFGVVKNRLVPVFTYASLSDVLTDEQMDRAFSNVKPWGLTSAHPAGTTVRLTPDNRVFIRNTLDFNPKLASSPHQRRRAWQRHRQALAVRFPELTDLQFRYTWGGMLCMTRNHESVFRRIDEATYVVCGCNGVGVAKGTYLGYYMADFVAGVESSQLAYIRSNNKPSWVPPDPLRTLVARSRLRREASAARGDL
ncbi:hypothetical protein MesoLj131b_71750 (plasmid) [Mesorhizobium sp. 131-2-5]|uniref:NAD(P)/FAD-dependent oxidoreductase n=1 Tax=Mesorhizobium sp. 131-2-5 TaxID=2744519 RepID=UPI0018EB07EE|nr:FAD-binding oxidoreductase [Mesorhizobium sp. 131-2-5]BCH05176.1 hypothetical protein MesoLj131b_71750 [Mesorhizobium sp. 131-2-5]